MITLEQAIRNAKRILIDAMAADSLSRYVLDNISELVEAAKIIAEFGMDTERRDAVGADRLQHRQADSAIAGRRLDDDRTADTHTDGAAGRLQAAPTRRAA